MSYRYIEFAQEQDRLQYGTLVVAVAAIPVFGIDGSRLEQPDLVVPHQCLFVDAVECGELPDGQQFVFFTHFFVSLLYFFTPNSFLCCY